MVRIGRLGPLGEPWTPEEMSSKCVCFHSVVRISSLVPGFKDRRPQGHFLCLQGSLESRAPAACSCLHSHWLDCSLSHCCFQTAPSRSAGRWRRLRCPVQRLSAGRFWRLTSRWTHCSVVPSSAQTSSSVTTARPSSSAENFL